jgi:hypothetical protein
MDSISTEQMWRRIPPEEKFQLLARSHASGTSAVLFLLCIFSILSVGLRESLVFWFAVLLIPVAFQRSASRRWRELKPQAIIEYLAVRAAARRLAFLAKAEDLAVLLILRGLWVDETEKNEIPPEPSFTEPMRVPKPVWLVMLGDCLVCMSEAPSGAELEYVALISKNLEMQSVTVESPRGGRIPVREFRFWKSLPDGDRGAYRFTSEFHGAMMVFETRLEQQKRIIDERAERTRRKREAQMAMMFGSGES